jgi:hypothetical protein
VSARQSCIVTGCACRDIYLSSRLAASGYKHALHQHARSSPADDSPQRNKTPLWSTADGLISAEAQALQQQFLQLAKYSSLTPKATCMITTPAAICLPNPFQCIRCCRVCCVACDCGNRITQTTDAPLTNSAAAMQQQKQGGTRQAAGPN